jgi:cellulose synthase/poly-beta-1,6-N-acetylglucosamine synthase-like glycosyltransferase
MEPGSFRLQPADRRDPERRRSEAKGDLLIFVDADTRVNPEVVRAAYETMKGGAVGGGAAVPVPRAAALVCQGALTPLAVWVFRKARLAAGCFLFATRRAFRGRGRL